MAAWPSRHRSHAGVPPSRCVRLLGGDPNGCELPTLPKTNVAAENVVSRKERMIVYQLLIFRGYVKLRGCNWNHFQRCLYKWLLKSNQPCVSGFPSFFEISPLGNLLRKRGATSPCCTVWSRDHRTPNTTWRQPYVCHVTLLDGNKLRLPSSTGSPEWESDGVSASKKKKKITGSKQTSLVWPLWDWLQAFSSPSLFPYPSWFVETIYGFTWNLKIQVVNPPCFKCSLHIQCPYQYIHATRKSVLSREPISSKSHICNMYHCINVWPYV